MASLTNLATSNLALKGAGTTYNFINRFFATKAEADAALADSSWQPVAGRLNAALTGDQGLLVYNESTQALDLADQATRAYVDTKLAALTGDAPALLNTLGEISDALNDDPNFFATVAASRAANAAAIAAETVRAGAAEAAIQADVDQNEADADAAIAAVQADVNQNEADADAAIAAEAAARATAVAAVQADVDQNESDADTAIAAEAASRASDVTSLTNSIAAVQADVNQNESDADSAIAAVQADVDQNESDADAAIAAVQADVDQNESDADAAIAAVQADVDANEAASVASLATKAPLASPALTGTPTSPTASQGAGTTQIATTAYVDTAVSNLIDASPGALNTLNELAAAIGDDANFSTTITNSIAAVQADVNQNELDADNAIATVQADVDANEAAAATARTNLQNAINAVQADVDQNESDADTAIATKLGLAGGTLTGSLVVHRDFPDFQLKSNQEKRVLFTDAGGGATGAIKNVSSSLTFFAGGVAGGNLEMTVASDGVDVSALKIAGAAVTATAAELNYVDGVTSNVQTQLDAIQADVNQNESDADAAIAAVQADVNQNESDADAAIAAVQADVDQNEADADAAIAAETTARTAAVAAVQADVDANEAASDAAEAAIVDGTTNFTGFKLAGTAVTATGAELNILDGVTSTAAEINKLDGVTASTAEINYVDVAAVGTAEASKAVVLDAGKSISGINQLTCVDLTVQGTTTTVDTVTMQAANAIEFEGATADSNETTLTIIDPTADRTIKLPNQDGCIPVLAADSNTQITATPAELNVLDGITATVAELNYTDGVTSNIQTQLNAIQADVDQNESDADAAQAANETHIDNVATLLGIAKDGVNFGAFSGSTIADNQTLKTILQALETDTESRLAKAGGTLTGNLTLRKSDGSAVALVLSRQDHADMSCVWKIQPSYVSATKEVLSVLANGQVVAHFDERQRFAINMTDPDYTLDVGGDGHFSTNLVVGGSLTLGSTAVTSTAAELNILDGVTATAAELNVLDGITSTVAELNILDGVTATAAELNALDGITATVAELNYTDGVTSNIQTQLDAKLASETITLTAFKTVVAASSDFADFKSRVAAL